MEHTTYKTMNIEEIYKEIGNSSDTKGYIIVYLINNNHFADAADQIMDWFDCEYYVAMKVVYMIKFDLEIHKSNISWFVVSYSKRAGD